MRILVAGDFCPHDRVVPIIEEGHFKELWNDVPDITKGADYSILNLECPVVEHQTDPIDKCGPNLKCSAKAIDAIKYAGFDCATLANNHFCDYGEIGVNDTLSALQNQNIDHVGGGVNLLEASKILYKEVNGKKLAVVNCCEHEFSIASETTGGSNPLNPIQQYYAIHEARRNADRVVVIVHGGVELFWLPSKRMIETYRFFIDAGADAVVNHHQHCYSGYEIYKEKPIFYGLGNFCFDGIGSGDRWVTGFMLKLDLTHDHAIKYEMIPYRQCDEKVGVHLMVGEEIESFYRRVEEYNMIIKDDARRECEYLRWCDKNKEMYKSALNPLYNRLTKKIFDGVIGKRMIGKVKWLHIKNYMMNESHIERVRLLIEQNIK